MNVFLVAAVVVVALLLLAVLGGSREYRRAWSGWDAPDATGFSPFQVKCEAVLLDVLAANGIELVGRHVEDLGGRRRSFPSVLI